MYYITLCYYKGNEVDKALEYCEKTLDMGPNSAGPWYLLGSIYLKQEKFEKAREACKKSLKINPNYENAVELLKNLSNLDKS